MHNVENKGAVLMNNWWYTFFMIVLGIVGIFTGEIITFIMLGFILVALININTNIKKLIEQKHE